MVRKSPLHLEDVFAGVNDYNSAVNRQKMLRNSILRLHKVFHDLFRQLISFGFITDSVLLIKNTSKDSHPLSFRKITAVQSSENTIAEWTQRRHRAEVLQIVQEVCAEVNHNKNVKGCHICGQKPIEICTVEEEAALVNDLNLKFKQRIGIRRFLNFKGILKSFPPYRALKIYFNNLVEVCFKLDLWSFSSITVI